jgi:hypothetical protein
MDMPEVRDQSDRGSASSFTDGSRHVRSYPDGDRNSDLRTRRLSANRRPEQVQQRLIARPAGAIPRRPRNVLRIIGGRGGALELQDRHDVV